MEKYLNYGRKMGGRPCVSIKNLEPNGSIFWDDALSGPKGEIWLAYPSRGLYRAVIPHGKKSEKVISFDSKDLRFWINKLEVPLKADEQMVWANNPNSRLE